MTTVLANIVAKSFGFNDLDDRVGQAYQGHPDRLYLVGKDGKIAFAGDRGPFGFRPQDLESAIKKELAKQAP